MKKLLLTCCLTLTFFSPASAEEAKTLFDGATFTGWTLASGAPVGAGWEVKDGAIHRKEKGGDIVTAGEYLNFELEFEWKVAPGANSGLKYRVSEYAGAKNIGLEHQVLDDAGHANGKVPKTTAGSIYELVAPGANKKLKPVGEWNSSKIIANGNSIEHWLNGEKIVSVTIGSDEWKAALATSKFKKAADFGTKKGKILLQDHGDEAWFRNIKIKELPAKAG